LSIPYMLVLPLAPPPTPPSPAKHMTCFPYLIPHLRSVFKCQLYEKVFVFKIRPTSPESYFCNKMSDRQNKTCLRIVIFSRFFIFYKFWIQIKILERNCNVQLKLSKTAERLKNPFFSNFRENIFVTKCKTDKTKHGLEITLQSGFSYFITFWI